jgi:SAM-dependent methyltransferase
MHVFPIKEYDGRTIPFAGESFDIVFSSNVLEHVPDLARMHAEIRRVLKPDGFAVHVLPTPAWRIWTSVAAFPAAFRFFTALGVGPRRPFTRDELHRVRTAWYKAARRLARTVLQRPHGIRGNVVSEMWLYRAGWWRKNFEANGFRTEHDEALGLFYTGNMAIGRGLSIAHRVRLAHYLGSACHVFVLRQAAAALRDGSSLREQECAALQA